VVHNLKRGKCQILALRGHHNYLRTWDCHDDVVYTASQDETAKVWDLRTRVGATFSGHVGPVTGIQPVAPPLTLASVPSGRNLGDAQRASARRNTGKTRRRTDKCRKAMAAPRKYVVTGSMGRCVWQGPVCSPLAHSATGCAFCRSHHSAVVLWQAARDSARTYLSRPPRRYHVLGRAGA